MLDPDTTRQELRAILANPDSTREQILQVKLILAKRITDVPNKVRQTCGKYKLSPEKSAAMVAGLQERMGERIKRAEQEVQRMEHLLAQKRIEAGPEQPDA